MDIYRENILDHYRNPRNFGKMEEPSSSHEEYNPFCGDRIKIQVKIQNSKFKSIKFSGEGCAISIASASMLTEEVKEAKLEGLRELKKDAILEMLGIQLSPTRLKCALLPLEVLQKAMTKFHERFET